MAGLQRNQQNEIEYKQPASSSCWGKNSAVKKNPGKINLLEGRTGTLLTQL